MADELPFPLDQDGFLDMSAVDPRGSAGDDPAGRLVTARDALSSGALVLLGEPGLGKTTELRRLGEFLDQGDEVGTFVEVNGADITDRASFDELVGSYLRALPTCSASTETMTTGASDGLSHALLIVIDQVDECPILHHLAGLLRRALDSRDTSSLRLALGCRTADLPSNLTRALADSCGSCRVADLAPLTRAEATALASSVEGVDGKALIAAAIDSGAGALASVPLSLELLVRTFRRRNDLNVPPAELFAAGVVQLIDEHDPDRRIAGDRSTPGQRRAVAERIAARLVLSGRRTIWRGHALDAGEHDIDEGSFVGGHETCESGPFAVTPELVAATLATGLFTARGANRLAFRHGSFAAYLAAGYLQRRSVPAAQLRRLFLIPAGGNSQTIPVSLRETAAWVVTNDAANTEWLVDADPESLVPHSRLVDSPKVRALIVSALLRRAGEIEAGDQSWARASRHLAHPGLDAQLLEVLAGIEAGQPSDWESVARIRLAVRIARETRGAGLVDPLLSLAEHDAWEYPTRVLAALAAFEIDPDEASARLRKLLARLADPRVASSIDADDELRGTLLQLLWPRYISTVDALPYLSRRVTLMFFGAYRRFRHTFVARLPEQDIGATLEWVVNVVDRVSSSEAGRRTSSDGTADQEDGLEIELDFLNDLLDRALSAQDRWNHVQAVAAILYHSLDGSRRPELPRPIDVVDAEGAEPDDARSLRRAVAYALVERSVRGGPFTRATAWKIVDGWSDRSPWRHGPPGSDSLGLRPGGRRTLLDSHDFPWLYRACAEARDNGQTDFAEGLAITAAWIFDLADDESAVLASSDESHPVWRHVKWWFEPIPIDSETAQHWRELHPARNDDGISPEDLAAFHQDVQRLFAAARAGDPQSFWHLAYLLQCEPQTAQGPTRLDDDLLNFPATSLLPDDHEGGLTEAALHYVNNEHDHADAWAGQGRWDKRAWAGYLAFALLHRRGRLNEISNERWALWVHALINFHALDSGPDSREVKRNLLARAAQHAPQQFAEALKVYVRSEITRGNVPDVNAVDLSWTPHLADAWAELVTELASLLVGPEQEQSALRTDAHRAVALTAWEQMVSALLGIGDTRGRDLALQLLSAVDSGEHQLALVGRAGRALLRSNAAAHLPTVLAVCQPNPTIGREVALATAAAYDARSILEALSVEQLVSVYRWLSDLFPPNDDPERTPGFQRVTPEQQARTWRDRVPEVLASRGTAEAAEALNRLCDEHPDRLILRFSLMRCRAVAAAEGWRAPAPDEIVQLLDDTDRRLARSDEELRDVLIEVLQEIAADIASHGDLLWDRIPKGATGSQEDRWCPKLEYALQQYLAHELDLRVARRGLIVNREVLVRPTNASTGAGDRTDILVQASLRFESSAGPVKSVATVIEIKGSWNEELLTAQRTQLAERYLPASRAGAGIYLVGWYPLDQWTYPDHRRPLAAKRNREELRTALNEQAVTIGRELGTSIRPYLLDVPRPSRAKPGGEPSTNKVTGGRSTATTKKTLAVRAPGQSRSRRHDSAGTKRS